MHHTFYIDVDEEISSVIDRLKRSMAVDNYFVAPKRAIFLQSIVNLKLLKREADKMRKRVILVTQEEIVAAMASRSGIEVQKTIEGVEENLNVELKNEEDDFKDSQSQNLAKQSNDKAVRLKNIGSSEFSDGQDLPERQTPVLAVKKSPAKSVPATNFLAERKAPVFGENKSAGQKKAADSISSQSSVNRVTAKDKVSESEKQFFSDSSSNFSGTDFEKERKSEKLFPQPKKSETSERQIANPKTRNFLFIFIIVCLFLLAGVAGYLFVPSADIIIKPNVQTIKIDTDIKVGSQQGASAITAHVINEDQQITLQYNTTGKSSSSGKKAQGTVVIYNEFDNQPQTLVATTRLQADNGKVFRLLKTVVVPGLSNVGGQAKPGAISAQVVADESGSEYNLEASNFKIPGFQGGPKYDKFYAKSTATFGGGTTEGNGSAGVSQSDLDSAKQKTEAALKEKIAAAILAQLKPEELALPQAEKITIDKSLASAKVGDGVGSFEYTVTASVSALAFSGQEVRDILTKSPELADLPKNSTQEIKKIDYVSVEPNFDVNTMLLKVHGEIAVTPKIDVEFFKSQLLGKNETELLAVLKKNQTEIESASVNFWPTFINRTPQFPQRLKIEIEKGQ